VQLNGADLEGSNWRGAHSCGTGNLSDCNVAADFSGANLRRADFSGADLAFANFTGADLTMVNFSNARLSGAIFTQADSTGANFVGARFGEFAPGDPPTPAMAITADLRAANLTKAILTGAQLYGVDLSNANLTSADLRGAQFTSNPAGGIPNAATLAGATLSNANLEGANCTGARFNDDNGGSPTRFVGATLTGVNFSSANLSGVDLHFMDLSSSNFSSAVMYGATLTNAKLDDTNFSGAFLTHSSPQFPKAADLSGAHLKNANFTSADLGGALFVDASLYGTVPVNQGTCDTSQATPTCATLSRADLTNTDFTDAFLFGVDFTRATMKATTFIHAVVAGANFADVNSNDNTSTGLGNNFNRGFLQGANFLAARNLTGTDFANAFMDFRPGGNTMYVKLDGNHTMFPGWPTPSQPVCALVYYANPTTVPTDNATFTCPDGTQAFDNSPSGCGPIPTDGSMPSHWKSPDDIATTSPSGAYAQDSTFTPRNLHCVPDFNW